MKDRVSQRSGIQFKDEVSADSDRKSDKLGSSDKSSLSSFYPQSSSWEKRKGSVVYSSRDDPVSIPPSPSTIIPSIESAESIKDLGKLFTKLKDTLETLKGIESKNGKRISNIVNQNNFRGSEYEPRDQEIIILNIWNNVHGELQLAERKPLSKKMFDEIESTKEFPKLINVNVNDKNPLFTAALQNPQFPSQNIAQVGSN